MGEGFIEHVLSYPVPCDLIYRSATEPGNRSTDDVLLPECGPGGPVNHEEDKATPSKSGVLDNAIADCKVLLEPEAASEVAERLERLQIIATTQFRIAELWPFPAEDSDSPWDYLKKRSGLWRTINRAESAIEKARTRYNLEKACADMEHVWLRAINRAVAKYGNTLSWPKTRYIDSENWDLQAAAKAFPWPPVIPGIGVRKFSGNENCEKCHFKTSYVYGVIPLCLHCAEEKSLRFPLPPNSYFGWLHRRRES
jgi:hypothetical protein